MSLSPFEVLKAPMSDVFDIYVNCIIHDKRKKGETSKNEDVWVTSKTANWH